MQDTYNELTLWSLPQFREIFLEFIFESTGEALEELDDSLILRSEDDLDLLIHNIKLLADELSQISGIKEVIKLELTKKKNEDWIENYKKSVNPLSIGTFYVRAPWHEPKDDLVDIIIEPALAFGSGHHESTSSCIELLQKNIKSGKTLLDVGSGSGILGICATKLGACVDFCDTDELAINESLKNFRLNNASYFEYWVGGCQIMDKEYDAVVANIIADIIVIIASDLAKRVKKGGFLLLSGILDKHEKKVMDAFRAFSLEDKIVKNEWLTLKLVKE